MSGKNKKEGKVQKSELDSDSTLKSLEPSFRNVKLLSFGADEGGEEEEAPTFQKKSIYRPDCMLRLVFISVIHFTCVSQ